MARRGQWAASLSFAVGLAAPSLVSRPASAAPIVFVGYDIGAGAGAPRPNANQAAAAFDAATGPLSVISFEGEEHLGTVGEVAPGVTVTGVDFFGQAQAIVNKPDCIDVACGYNTTSGGSQWLRGFGGSLSFSFETPIEAFGLYLTGPQLMGETMTFDDGSPQSILIPDLTMKGGVAFLGFTNFGAPFSSVTLQFVGMDPNVSRNTEPSTERLHDIVGVDDVRYDGGNAVPEPGTLALFGAGLLGLALRLRRAF